MLFGITFVNALIKTLVAESHNKDNVEVKHASFDLAMKNQVNTMNAQLPIRIDEYTICVEVSYTVLESVWILPLISFMLYFSVYLRLFLPSLHSLFLQIDHYLLRPNSANLLKNTSQLNLK